MHLPTLSILSFLLLFLAAIPCIFLELEITRTTLVWTILLMIPWLLFHELLHSFSYMICGANFKNITYGISLEKSVLYCLCKQNISKKNILVSLLTPFFLIGIVTYILGTFLGNEILILLSILNISGSVGDLVMFFFIVKLKEIEFSEFDNPLAFGIFTKENLEKEKAFGLRFMEKKEALSRIDFQKVRISKLSILILISLLLLCGFLLFLNCI